MVTVAIAISYFDRQTLPVAIGAIQHSIPLTNQQFSWLQSAFLVSYALLYAGGGRLLDVVGTKRGFLLIMLWWSVACMLHGLAWDFYFLLAARFLLGMGEGGGFPAATRVIAEWLPMRERSTAMGIINGGTAIGSVIAPPLIGLVLWLANWRSVFFLSGAIGLIWSLWWARSYRALEEPASSASADAENTAIQSSWFRLLQSRQVVGMVLAKFMSDAAWYFYLFWLPKYLYDARGFDVKHVSYSGWIPYAAAGVGSVSGGWLSSWFLRNGRSLDFSRKAALGLSAILMPVVMFVTHASIPMALALFSIAFFGQQSWSTLIMTLPADIFPLASVGSVAGLIGFGGAIGGAVFSWVAGQLLGHGFGYRTLFTMFGTFHLIAFAILVFMTGTLRPRDFDQPSLTYKAACS